MTSKKTTRRALLSSVIALLLCVSMLVGSTFAWFTDEVTSTGNIIKSGTLDIELLHSDDNKEWKDASKGAIFNYQYWEPGYTQVKYVKIANVGNLALRYQLSIIPEMLPAQGDVNLGDVIDVYMLPAGADVSREAIAAATPVGTLSDLMLETDGAAHGVILPENGSEDFKLNPEDEDLVARDAAGNPTHELTCCIVLKMREEAGNEYQNLSVGKGFKVELLATQYTWENDSFDNMYDDDSAYDALPHATVSEMKAQGLPTYLIEDILNGFAGEDVVLTLDTAYAFKGEPVESAKESPYADWYVDFFVSLDKAPAEGLVLSGQYDEWSSTWIAFYVPTNGIEAGEFHPLLGTVTGGGVSNWTYTEICEGVGTFNCGAVDLKGLNEGTTMTVELRLINPEDTTETIVVKSVQYTFGKHAYSVFTAEDLQKALDNGETDIALGADITGNVTVTQKADVVVTIDGNGHEFAGVLTVDGKSATYLTAGLTVKNMVFKANSISADACIRLGDGTNATRYTCNVTVENCTFDVPGAVGVKSYTGGDKNLTITGCTATAACHSLIQAKGIDGILVENCKVYSKNGLNFNNSTNVTVDGCEVDVKGYAVRFGESSGGVGAAETYLIKNCTLKSANDDGDATIILRGTADYSTLTIENTTIVGTPDIANTATNATVVVK